MKYRQWKKNYKKKYGYNPPIEVDKRQQRKAAKKALVKEIQEENINTETKTIELKAVEIANDLKQGLCKAVAVMCEGLRIIFQKAGEVMTDTADRYNTIAERYSILAAVYNQSNKESEAINERE